MGGTLYYSEDCRDKNLKSLMKVITKKEMGWDDCLAVPSVLCEREPYGWTGQRKSPDALLVTITIAAL